MGFNEKLINFRVDRRPASVAPMAPVVSEELEVQARFAAEAPASMAVLRTIMGDPAASPRARRQAALILLPHLRQENGHLLRAAILKRKAMILELEREIAELQDRLDRVHLGPPTS